MRLITREDVSMPIVSDWLIRTISVKPRSATLKTLDGALNTLASTGAGVKDVNSIAAWNALQAWKTAEPAEAAKVSGQVTELTNEIVNVYKQGKKQIAGISASGVKPVGWTYQAWDPIAQNFTTAVAAGEKEPDALTPDQIQRVNEAMRRVKLAARLARDAMIRIMGRNNFGNAPLPVEEQAYVDYFGAYDEKRAQRVLNNFKVLTIAFERGPVMIDLRNTEYGKTCYAACYRNNLASKAAKTGELSLTGAVDMFLGRAFFKKGSYESSTDTTVGTLVHEFAHGAVDAVDVPPCNATGGWTHGRVTDDPNHRDFGETTNNSIQASTPVLDKLLARHRANYAIVNADSYGQFARQILQKLERT